jgi:hypothetical protein
MNRRHLDIYGEALNLPDVCGMSFPVRCTHCRGVYDMGRVEVTARYTDCSMWKAPCCNRLVDDRGDTGWKSTKDYVRLDSNGREVSR